MYTIFFIAKQKSNRVAWLNFQFIATQLRHKTGVLQVHLLFSSETVRRIRI